MMPHSDTAPQRILIIDDSVTNLKVVVDYLRAYSFEILTARDGSAGIERAQLAQPDLILLDVQMPGIDGFETCRRLRANPNTTAIPVIFMTAVDAPADKVRGLESGAVDYLSKPIDTSELLARVNTHIRLRALQRQLQQANAQLEAQVQERSAALADEIRQRIDYQAEKAGLLDLVRQQSEQLRHLTQLLLDRQDEQRGKTQQTYEQIDHDLGLLELHLERAKQLVPESATADLQHAALTQASAILQHIRHANHQASADLSAETHAQAGLRESPLLKLSDREYEIFQLLVQGRSNAEISEMLFLARTTISTYQRRIMEKLGTPDLLSLVKFAVEHGL